MKRFYLKFRIALMTLAIGLANVWFFNEVFGDIPIDLPKTQSGKTIILSDKAEDKFLEEIYSKLKEGEFEAIAHGCGNGYSTAYVSYDRKKAGDSVKSFGDFSKARKEFDAEISKAKNIIKPLHETIRNEKKVSRIILTYKFEEKEYVKILWIADNDKSYRMINAPDLKTVLEFETYLMNK